MRRFIAVVVLMAAGAAPCSVVAAGLETLIMPGKVTSAHSKLEQECSQCHDRADRSHQAALCMACHKDVAADVRGHSGFHGRIPGIATAQCKACHSEHQGRDADIVKLSPVSFDHSHTDFALAGAHATAACASCHKAGKKYRDAPPACVDCHRADDPHAGKLGTACANCHEASDWTRVRFDHDKTRYPLRDAHRETACAACHAGNRYAGTPSQCVSCHAPEDVHRGTRGPNCASCHSTAAWKTSKFDHAAAARFPLVGAHAKLECAACHKTPDLKAPLPRDCAGCHRADDAHATRFGAACEKCHSSSAWKPSTFDHARDTHYLLPGNHAKLGCHACHTSVVAEQKLGQDCASCHRTDDPHGAKLGQDCARCHAVDSWRKGITFDHDRTSFPLVGLHGPVPCHACHVSPAFKGTAHDCNSCHQRVDRHKGSLGKDCEQCHSPAGWNLWKFDHAKTAGGFALIGAHATAACASCHTQPPGILKLRTDCVACHSKDDVHLGQFGRQCQRCHGTVTFRDARPH